MLRKDGSWFWTVDKGKVIRTDDGRLAIVSICNDMTDFVRRQKELEQQNFLSESMFKNLPGGYHRCSCEKGFPFLYVSDRFLNILGWTEENIRTRFDNKYMNLVHPDDRQLILKYCNTVIQEKGTDNYADQIYRLLGKDGYHWVSDTTIFIAAGGRTGLTALTTAVIFLLSIFLLPVFASIPGAAASSALLYVGCLMLKGIKNVKIDTVKNAVPAFLTIAMMPLAYSITDGIGFGILSYVIIDLIIYIVDAIKYAANKKKGAEKPVWDLHVVTIIVAVLFLVYFFVPTTF